MNLLEQIQSIYKQERSGHLITLELQPFDSNTPTRINHPNKKSKLYTLYRFLHMEKYLEFFVLCEMERYGGFFGGLFFLRPSLYIQCITDLYQELTTNPQVASSRIQIITYIGKLQDRIFKPDLFRTVPFTQNTQGRLEVFDTRRIIHFL